MKLQAVKTIANFGVDFKFFLSVQGLIERLIYDMLHNDADEMKMCAAFALKNLGFGCNSKQQEAFDKVVPLSVIKELLHSAAKEAS